MESVIETRNGSEQPPASEPTFTYNTITTPETIRLLHLHPGGPNDPISLTLQTAPLSANPSYEAISYCWGAPTAPQHTVFVNNLALPISTSLFAGLHYFRDAAATRSLWADAICINQSDPTEKGQQILLMPRIYSTAARVLIWLGPCPASSGIPPGPAARACIAEALRLVPDFDRDDPAALARTARGMLAEAVRRRAAELPNVLDHDWAALTGVLARPWFRRKWVVQEVAHARDASVHCGEDVEPIPWLELAALTFRMEALGVSGMVLSEMGRAHRDSQEGEEGGGGSEERRVALMRASTAFTKAMHGATTILMVTYYGGRGTLLDAIMVTTSFQCTEPRDHVYAVLSLGAKDTKFEPRYDLSVAEVYRRYALRTLVEGKSLKILSLAPDKLFWTRPGTERLEGLPTWVPDLSRLGEVEQLVTYTTRQQLFFAGGRGDPVLKVSDDGRVLCCQGRVVDTVKEVGISIIDLLLQEMPEVRSSPDPPIDLSLERRQKRTARWLRSCHDVAFGDQTSPSSEMMAGFARTMLCGMVGMRDHPPAEVLAAFPEYLALKFDLAAGKKAQPPPAILEHAASIEQSMLSMGMGRRFCRTGNGRFGQLPLDAKEDDLICVLVGGEVPFVIRPAGEGAYTLLGECYVEGVMNGEAMDDDVLNTGVKPIDEEILLK